MIILKLYPLGNIDLNIRDYNKGDRVNQKPQQQLNIEIGEKESEGIYSNLALIVHSPQEIIIDFARVMPGVQKSKVYARIIMTPAHAKMLHKALEENIKKFESQFGQIKLQGIEEKNIGFQAGKTE
jgi:hypothetical protein